MKIKIISVVGAIAVITLTGCTIQIEYPDDSTIESDSDPYAYEVPYGDPELIDPEPTPTGNSRAVTLDTIVGETRDQAADIIRTWEPGFDTPPIVFYDDELTVHGVTFDPDTAAWYDGKIYIDADTFNGTRRNANFYYTIAHEVGHGLEEYNDPYYPIGKSSELYADCIAGAIGAEAGWDTDAMAVYTRDELIDDSVHGTGAERYKSLTGGATGGPNYCDLHH